jgi:hypothetical protein
MLTASLLNLRLSELATTLFREPKLDPITVRESPADTSVIVKPEAEYKPMMTGGS